MAGKNISARWRILDLGFVVAISITGVTGPSAVANDRVVEIAPDVAYQSALTDLFTAPDKSTFDNKVDQFLALRNGDVQPLIPQLLWFAAQHRQDARIKAFVGQVMARLSAPKEMIVAALAPQLDNRDETITAMVQDLLKGYEDHSATRPPDYSVYRSIIEADVRAGREPQTSLVLFMYSSDPGSALPTMVRACQLRDPAEIKPILWADHVVAELFWKRRYGFVERKAVETAVLQELDQLSKHPRWWVRLYVAQIVKTHPELGEPGVVKRLKDDADIRVRAHFPAGHE